MFCHIGEYISLDLFHFVNLTSSCLLTPWIPNCCRTERGKKGGGLYKGRKMKNTRGKTQRWTQDLCHVTSRSPKLVPTGGNQKSFKKRKQKRTEKMEATVNPKLRTYNHFPTRSYKFLPLYKCSVTGHSYSTVSFKSALKTPAFVL